MSISGIVTVHGDIIEAGATKIVNNYYGNVCHPVRNESTSTKTTFASAVINTAYADKIMNLLNKCMKDKRKPKDVMMPIRAAMEAGVIRRPTWDEFCGEFGVECIKQKSSFSGYTNPDKTPYYGAEFEALKEKFRQYLV